jgi:hypothetical protein
MLIFLRSIGAIPFMIRAVIFAKNISLELDDVALLVWRCVTFSYLMPFNVM